MVLGTEVLQRKIKNLMLKIEHIRQTFSVFALF